MRQNLTFLKYHLLRNPINLPLILLVEKVCLIRIQMKLLLQPYRHSHRLTKKSSFAYCYLLKIFDLID